MLVIDASAAVELALVRPMAGEIAQFVKQHEPDLGAPHLLDVEAVSALRRLVARGEATVAAAETAVSDLLILPIARYPHELLIWRVWALRQNLSAYDATYVALAESLGASLLTADARLARAADEHSDAQVILVD